MKKMPMWMWGCLAAGSVAAGAFLAGCEVSGSNEVIRDLPINFSGFYQDSTDGLLVSQNTGSPVKTMDLRQAGDRLECVDNNGMLYNGTIGNASGSSASFSLQGKTTVGQDVTVSGTLIKSGDTTAEMTGTWIEPSLFANIYGKAIISPVVTNEPPQTNTNVVLMLRMSREQWAAVRRPSWLWFMYRDGAS